MKLIVQFIPTYIVVFLVLGIITGYYIQINQIVVTAFLCIEMVALLVVYNKAKHLKVFAYYFSLLTFLVSFTIGIAAINAKNELNWGKHFANYVKKEINQNEKVSLKVTIEKVLKPHFNQHKFEAKVVSINQNHCKGKILLNLKTDSVSRPFEIDETLVINTPLKLIEGPKNPYSFDYQKYLQKQHIHYQVFIASDDIQSLGKDATSLKGFAGRVRSKINQQLEPYAIPKEEMAVINALLLGQRQDISKELMESYSKAGAIHILAVSGLHIGIILMMLHFLLKPLEFVKNGRLFKLLLLVLLLWVYALIAGLSPSVVRAVMMFTVVAIGLNLNKRVAVLHTLIISVLILLLINPYYLFEVGFQMSYAAVFSIVLFQPVLQSFWTPKIRIVRFYWNLLAVSVAAQLGVLPISLFYFHQFPGLFFITNLLIIPFLGIILMGGLLVFLLALLNMLPIVVVKVYSTLIFLMNLLVKWVSIQESFLISEIHFNYSKLIALLFLIVMVLVFLKNSTYKNLKYLLMVVIALQLVVFYTKYETEKRNELIVFYKSKQSVVVRKIGRELIIYSDSEPIKREKFISDFKTANAIENVKVQKPQNIFFYNNKVILLIDENSVYRINGLKPDIVILKSSPKINLKRLIEELQPKQIVVDATNYHNYVKNWEITCAQTKTPFHHMGQKGAFILN